MKSTLAGNENGAKLGSNPIVAKVILGSGLIGLILTLHTHPAAPKDVRIEELFEIMSEAVADYDFVETGILPKLCEKISLTAVSVDDDANPADYTFHSAIPLRNADDRKNYYRWNSKRSSWELRQFDPKYITIDGDKLMLIVKEKTPPGEPAEEAA